MWTEKRVRRAGLAAVVGGLLGLAVTPLMVIVKYSTGWKIIPEPAWVDRARPLVEPLVSFATPVQLWVLYGSFYTVSLLLMLACLLALRSEAAATARIARVSLGVLLVGLTMVLVGDVLHTATWHIGGETVPRANLNAAASAGISVEYLGIPLVFVSSFVLGIASLRAAWLPRAVSILLLAVAPGGVYLTVTQLPAMPSGSFSVFSLMIIVLGVALARGRRPATDTGGRSGQAVA